MAEPDDTRALNDATAFLYAFGYVAVAWLWIDQARCAVETVEPGDADFYAGKVRALHFFIEYELPRVDGWLQQVERASGLAAGMPPAMAGQRTLITGGASRLGKAMAEGFLALGGDVIICGRRKALCDEVAATWRERLPERRIETHGLDIRDAAAVEAMIDDIWRGGPLAGLVNNAAGNVPPVKLCLLISARPSPVMA